MKDFIERATIEYGQEYDYSQLGFSNWNNPVHIICPDHGLFKIKPVNFIYRAGCYKCRRTHVRGYPARRGHVKIGPKLKAGRKPSTYKFYILESTGGFLKFGITQGCINARCEAITRDSIFEFKIVFLRVFFDKKLCAYIERLIKIAFTTGVAPTGSMFDGATETVSLLCFNQITKIVNSCPLKKQ